MGAGDPVLAGVEDQRFRRRCVGSARFHRGRSGGRRPRTGRGCGRIRVATGLLQQRHASGALDVGDTGELVLRRPAQVAGKLVLVAAQHMDGEVAGGEEVRQARRWRARLQSTSGGSRDTDEKELAVIPTLRPSRPRVVITVTPVANCPAGCAAPAVGRVGGDEIQRVYRHGGLLRQPGSGVHAGSPGRPPLRTTRGETAGIVEGVDDARGDGVGLAGGAEQIEDVRGGGVSSCWSTSPPGRHSPSSARRSGASNPG